MYSVEATSGKTSTAVIQLIITKLTDERSCYLIKMIRVLYRQL